MLISINESGFRLITNLAVIVKYINQTVYQCLEACYKKPVYVHEQKCTKVVHVQLFIILLTSLYVIKIHVIIFCHRYEALPYDKTEMQHYLLFLTLS